MQAEVNSAVMLCLQLDAESSRYVVKISNNIQIEKKTVLPKLIVYFDKEDSFSTEIFTRFYFKK